MASTRVSSTLLFMEVVKAAVKLGAGSQRKVAVTTGQKSYSYGHLLASAWQISNILRADHFPPVVGVPTEDGCTVMTSEAVCQVTMKGTNSLGGARIGIMAKPSAEFVAGMWATWISGAVAVPLALSYPETELLHVMNDAGVSVILGTEEYRELLERIAQKCSARFYLLPLVPNTPSNLKASEASKTRELEDEFSGILFREMQTEVETLVAMEGDEPALIVYTSGTTGKPKGVVHTHCGIGAQVKMLTESWEYTSADQFLHCLPLHHVHGLFNSLLAPLYAGAVVDLMPKFSVRGVWQRWCESYPSDGSMAENAITVFTGVPTMYVRLLQGYEQMTPETQRHASSAAHQLRLMMCGSSALPYSVLKQWESITGQRLLERYGMTEFVMALSNPLDGNRKGGTVGKPLPGVQAKIVAENSNSDSALGAGELYVKSPSMFKEYWRQPQVTKESFGDDGYFKTGDTVMMDEDGYFIILGRASVDILKVGGYKLSALEIEATLLEHPDISECAVLGLPDKDYGEIICAVAVLEAEAKARAVAESKPVITVQDLQDWAKEKIAPYKIPGRLHVWESLPRNAMGKVNKKEMKQLLENA